MKNNRITAESLKGYVLGLVVLFSLLLRYMQVFAVDYPNGWDGSFYEMQLHTWLETGQLHSPNYSLIYVLMKFLTFFCSPANAYKLVTVLASSMFSVLIYVYSRKQLSPLDSLLVCLFTFFSPVLLFVSHQFTKNLLGLDFVLLYFVFQKKDWKLIPLLFLAFFTHRLAFVMLLFLGAWELTSYIHLRKWIFWLVPLCALFGIFSFIPGMPTLFDYARVIPELQLSFTWGFLDFYRVWSSQAFGWVWYVETAVFHVVLLMIALYYLYKKALLPLACLFLLLLLPIYDFSSGSLGYRLFLNACCLLFLFLPLCMQRPFFKKGMVALLILGLPFGLMSYDAPRFDPPIAYYKLVASRVEAALKNVADVSMIIAHKGIKEQIILTTDHQALNWAVPTHMEQHAYRLVYGVEDQELIATLGQELSSWKRISKNYLLTSELEWRRFMDALEEEGKYQRINELQSWLNPYQQRPLYLQ